jgi:hypothetical protein
MSAEFPSLQTSSSRNAQSIGLNPIVPDIATRNLRVSKLLARLGNRISFVIRPVPPVATEQQCPSIARSP